MVKLLIILLLLLTAPALAQQSDAVNTALLLSLDLQKKAVAAQDLAAALAQARDRIAQLEKICGEPCKPIAEAK